MSRKKNRKSTRLIRVSTDHAEHTFGEGRKWELYFQRVFHTSEKTFARRKRRRVRRDYWFVLTQVSRSTGLRKGRLLTFIEGQAPNRRELKILWGTIPHWCEFMKYPKID